MFRWFKKKVKRSDIEAFKDAISIDVSGPDFFDLYPTKDEFAERLRQCGLFRHDAIEWMAEAIHEKISAGGSSETARKAVTRSGRPLSEAEVQALGLHKRTKLGECFAAGVASNEIKTAMDKLRQIIHFEISRANKLHNLRRYNDAGITHVRLMSANDERCTALERKLEGEVMTVADARRLVKAQGDEISRSAFMALVEF